MADTRPTILHADMVRTMDPARPAAEAIGVRGGRIAAVGSIQQVRAAIGPDASEERVSGTLLPGFVDPHNHASLAISDRYTRYLSLPAGSTIRDVLARLKRVTSETTTRWVRAHGYNPLDLKELRAPTAEELDSVCPDQPLVAVAYGCHEAALNSLALAEMGWGPDTPDPPGGLILRDRRGRPLGPVVETAAFLVEAKSAEAIAREEGDEPWLARCESYCRDLLAAGITRIGDASVTPGASRLYQRAEAAGRLPLTVHRMPVGAQSLAHPHFEGPPTGEGPPGMPVGPAKLIVDGGDRCALCLTPGQVAWSTSWMLRRSIRRRSLAPFTISSRGGPRWLGGDGRIHSGIRILDDPMLLHATLEGTDRGFQVAYHALGNEAVASVLDVIGLLERKLANLPGRARIEHAMLVDPDLIRRIASSAAMVVGQPSFVHGLGDDLLMTATPPPLRVLPFRSMLDAGIELAASSDFPVVPFDVLAGIQGAVTRRTASGALLESDEAIHVDEALRAYTFGGARALGVDAEAGTISAGKRADLVLLSADPLATPPNRLTGLRILRTYVGGHLAAVTQNV